MRSRGDDGFALSLRAGEIVVAAGKNPSRLRVSGWFLEGAGRRILPQGFTTAREDS
jgi:hypothetical protein